MSQTASPATPAAEKPAKPVKIEQNGVTRPGADTQTGIVWDIADQLSATAGAPAKRADVLKAAEAKGINVTTAATQFGRWCKFNGVKATPVAKESAEEKAAKKAAAKAEKEAAKAAAKAAKDAEKAAKTPAAAPSTEPAAS